MKRNIRAEKQLKRIYFDEFWRLYDDDYVVISQIFRDRLKDPNYYTVRTWQQQCGMLKWFFENMSKYDVNKVQLHGGCIRIWKEEGLSYRNPNYYEIRFKKTKNGHVPSHVERLYQEHVVTQTKENGG